MTTTQERQVVDLLKAIETGAAQPVGVINPQRYTQHNLGAADGLAGFGALIAALPPNSAKANTVRVFQDGDFVVAHTDYNLFGPKIGFDIFRLGTARSSSIGTTCRRPQAPIEVATQ
jgi:predicted SnoaL-like aldol condensation-catalyzing enzyme